MKVALCCIGRLENQYAVEYVEHYKQLGFDHIYIGDNNEEEEEKFEDVLQSYINDGYVTIIDLHKPIFDLQNNKVYQQNQFYEKIYKQFSFDYDWMAFFDFDEFLILLEDKTIKEYLSRKCFKEANQILINWKIYTDNNLIYNDKRPCLERFTEPMYINKDIDYPNNELVKPIIKTKLNNIMFYYIHYYEYECFENTTYNSLGNKIDKISSIQPINYNLAYIKHFFTKTLEEYMIKLKKWESYKYQYIVNLIIFFKINKLTYQKIKYLKSIGYTIKDLKDLSKI